MATTNTATAKEANPPAEPTDGSLRRNSLGAGSADTAGPEAPAAPEASPERPIASSQSDGRPDGPGGAVAQSTVGTAAATEPGSKKGTARTRKKRARRRRGTSGAGAGSSASEAPRPAPAAAEVTRTDDAIVIRFPEAGGGESAEPPARSAAGGETGSAAAESGDGKNSAGSDAAEQPAAAPARPKRRRRRKNKETRPAAAEPEAPAEPPEPEAQPAEARTTEGEEEARATSEKRRRRRRRSRRTPERVPAKPAASEPAARPSSAAAALQPAGGKEMIINVVPREECRIGLLEDGKLQEIHIERASAENYVGNIYKGLVTNVEPSIQAAFVNFGAEKNGFLHISDLHPQYFPRGTGTTEDVGRKIPRRSRPPIQRCLRRGQEVIVQVTKEGIGTKGPTLTTYLSVPGRFLVMMPGMRQLGVSRKIEDDEARRKLRDQLQELNLPENIGFIARTAAQGHTKRELQSDLSYLTRLWKAVQQRVAHEKAPCEIYTESDLVIRTIRDVYTTDISRIVVDDPVVAQRAREFLAIFSPRSGDVVVEYTDPEPIFHRYGIEAELDRLHSRTVPLKSGGSLVIDQTEALVAIDVNSGRFRTEEDAETTAYKINLEAADEIPRQLRLRDLGGVVICDFIDMRQEKHKREIERRLARNLRQHKERAKVLRMSAFGIIELTRQRQRASLMRTLYQECEICRGTGLIKTKESVALDVMRLLQLAVTRENVRSIVVTVSPPVGDLLLNQKRAQLHDLEARHNCSITIRPDPSYRLDQIHVQYCDARGRLIPNI